MAQRVGPLSAEITEGEGDKFTAPLLLVHGLWDTRAVWLRFTGYLAHRGWRCIAVHLRGRAGSQPATGLADHLADLGAAITALEVPPVVVGHDLGGLLALQSAPLARAAIALAPLVPGSLASPPSAALRHAGNWLARRRRRALSVPGGRWQQSYPPHHVQVQEPAVVVRELLSAPVRVKAVPQRVPGIVLAGEHDPVTSVEAAVALADHAGVEFQVCAGAAHGLPSEVNWEARAATVHSWVVRRLGVDLLALYEEATQDDGSGVC